MRCLSPLLLLLLLLLIPSQGHPERQREKRQLSEEVQLLGGAGLFSSSIVALSPPSSFALGPPHASFEELFDAFLLRFHFPRYDPNVAQRAEWAKCESLEESLILPKNPRKVAFGTVKNIFVGRWKSTNELVAVSRLKNESYNGDFSSGIARLRQLQGHPNIIPLLGVCPEWSSFTAASSALFSQTLAHVVSQGHAALFNTIVTPFLETGDLGRLLVTMETGAHSDNWQQRLLLAIQYARVITFLHNLGPEKNPFNHPLVQKDRKISQFLLSSDLRLYLNDVEAMPLAETPLEVLEDLRFMPVILRHIFDEVTLPPHLNQTLEEIYLRCGDALQEEEEEEEEEGKERFSSLKIFSKLLSLVDF